MQGWGWGWEVTERCWLGAGALLGASMHAPPPRHHRPLSPSPGSRDYAIACVNEAAAASAARAGRVPTQALPKPRLTDSSWRSMFDRHVRWKAWTVDRLGGGYTPRG